MGRVACPRMRGRERRRKFRRKGSILTEEALATSETAAPEATETSQQNSTGHSHEEHAHHHHAPALNPELKREVYVEASAAEVSKAFSKTTKSTLR